MQEVFMDGTLGTIQDFNSELMEQLLSKSNVDHIRVFEKESGGKVGLSTIKEKDLESKIEKIVERKIKEAETRKNILEEYAKLERMENLTQ